MGGELEGWRLKVRGGSASWRAGEIGEQGWQGVLTVEMGLSFAVLVPRVVEKEERALERLGMMAVHR